jgi:hypothetical protein
MGTPPLIGISSREMMDMYTSLDFDALCTEVAKLKTPAKPSASSVNRWRKVATPTANDASETGNLGTPNS